MTDKDRFIGASPRVAKLTRSTQLTPPHPDLDYVSLVSGHTDPAMTKIPHLNLPGYFSRGEDGSIDGMHVGGRYATRVR
jgi:hypothetical protein